GRNLHPRRTHDGPAPRRRRTVARPARPARRVRQVGDRHRTPPGRDGPRRLDHRPRPRRRPRRWAHRLRRHPRRAGGAAVDAHRRAPRRVRRGRCQRLKSGRSISHDTATPATSPQNAAPMFHTVMFEAVTTNATSAPIVCLYANPATKAPCNALSIARPPRVATNEAGAAIIHRTNSGANSPKTIASVPHVIAAVY